MKQLIITADDYGMSPAVNAGIELGVEKGVITSTNVMTNMPEYKSAAKLKERYPQVSVGLHWTVSCGKPVLRPEQVRSLVDLDGNFYPPAVFVKRFQHNQIKKRELKAELVAQYNRYVEVCGKPDYWNTHQNTHVHLKLFGFFVDLAAELQIPKMRFHQKIWVRPADGYTAPVAFRLKEAMKSVVLKMWRRRIQRKGMCAPDGLIAFVSPSEGYAALDFLERACFYKNDNAELVIHPATAADSIYLGNLTRKRLEECRLFRAMR